MREENVLIVCMNSWLLLYPHDFCFHLGAVYEFEDVPGLANLLELLLLKHCKKHRKVDNFIEYLHTHHGHVDNEVILRGNEQSFSFEVDPQFLSAALHR